MGDVTLNADTCNSNIQENVDYRRDEPPSDNWSIRSWIERCQSEDGKSDIEKQQNENKYVEHVQEDLSNLARRLNRLTLEGNEKEEGNVPKIITIRKNQ